MKKKTQKDIEAESSEKALKISKQMIRSDWGGQDPIALIQKQAAEQNLQLGPRTAQFIKELVEDQMASSRKRAFDRIDMVIARLKGEKAGEKEESP